MRTREVGKAWAKRSLGIALALCMSLTVGGDLTVRSSAGPGTLFGIDAGIVLVGVVSAIALLLILAAWRSRRRRSEQETESEETPVDLSEDGKIEPSLRSNTKCLLKQKPEGRSGPSE